MVEKIKTMAVSPRHLFNEETVLRIFPPANQGNRFNVCKKKNQNSDMEFAQLISSRKIKQFNFGNAETKD